MVAVLTVGAGLVGTALTVVVAQLSRLSGRIKNLEAQDRRSWLYIRQLIDYAYRHTDVSRFPLPEPPDGWLSSEAD